MNELLKAKSLLREMGVTLLADKAKQGGGGAWKFAGEDNLIKTIQKPLTECGLELISTIEYLPEFNMNIVKVTLIHIDSGESINSTISMPPIVPKNDRNGNAMYLDAEIERGKQFGYWSRTLSIRLLGLSDIDPEDINNRPERLHKEYHTWSKANANDKTEYKKEFFATAMDYGMDKDMFEDFFSFIGVDISDEKAKHNTFVQYLRSGELFSEQIEAYLGWRRKQLADDNE